MSALPGEWIPHPAALWMGFLPVQIPPVPASEKERKRKPAAD